jgi:hypothetical protein
MTAGVATHPTRHEWFCIDLILDACRLTNRGRTDERCLHLCVQKTAAHFVRNF